MIPVSEFSSSESLQAFKRRAYQLSRDYADFLILDHHEFEGDRYGSWEFLGGLGIKDSVELGEGIDLRIAEEKLKQKKWWFGFLSYDLKNRLFDLSSSNFDGINFPDLYFFSPEIILGVKHGKLYINDPDFPVQELLSGDTSTQGNINPVKGSPVNFKKRISESSYLSAVNAIKNHILDGDIYELNFCYEHYFEGSVMDPWKMRKNISRFNPAPFSSFLKKGEKFLIGASPERFLNKTGHSLVAQPMKGTSSRTGNPEEDKIKINELLSDPKEKAENVMIVDLMRSDLSRVCHPGSVHVPELFGIYKFPHVFQMISSVKGKPQNHFSWPELLLSAFPMGSMTGAPKKRAMELTEQYEETRRGLFSGALGYVTPEGDFDFSVVIRSLLFNREANYGSLQTGGAITHYCIPEKEYSETLIKADSIKQAMV